MEHLDTKIIENETGAVEFIIFDYHPNSIKGGITSKLAIVIEGSLIVLEIKEDKLHQLKYFKDLHYGKKNNFFIFFKGRINCVKRFMNKVVTAGEDGVLKCVTFSQG